MVSTAAGLSKMGYIPVVDTFAQFGVTKGALPLTMAALSEAPIIAVFSHTGFQDAADGASHQGLSYFSMVASIPKVDVYSLSCSQEADELMTTVIEKYAADLKAGKVPHSSIFFLGRENFPKNYVEGMKFSPGHSNVLADTTAGKNKSVVIATTGSLVPEALKASEELAAEGVGSIVINTSAVNNIDVATYEKALAKTQGMMVTMEDHQLVGGFAQMLTHKLVSKGISLKLKSLGVHAEFGQSAYTALELYEKHQIDSKAAVKAVMSLIG
jgi:transketolase